MKNCLTILTPLLISATILMIGCQGKNRDEEDIKEILNSSQYTDEDQSRAFEDNDTIPKAGLIFAPADTMTIPWVRFVRKITSFTRHISVETKDTTATATIGSSATGYFIVVNDPLNPVCYYRPISDTGVRKVYLTKHNGRWHIRKITPKNIWTKDASIPITITSLVAIARPSGDTFVITTPDTFLTKEQLPTFHPDDTVKVTVTLQMPDDSAWVFLHRGRKRPHRRREPFLRISTYTFEREWIVRTLPDESHTGPEVRLSAIDAIQWQTLWGDSLAPYNCRAWCLPYIVKLPFENYPDSE